MPDAPRTFSAFVTPSGTNLHNTVADSNHLLASLNWVALRSDREKKSVSHQITRTVATRGPIRVTKETNTPIVG